MFSMESILRLYNEGVFAARADKYKRPKLGGGQAYDRSSD
jgi:hypothetical protein